MDYGRYAKDLQPTFYVSTGAIVQSLALTYLLSRTIEKGSPKIMDAFSSLPAQVYWLKFLIAFEIILLIWHEYVVGLIFFRWVWSFWDSFVPFLMGVAEFYLVTRLGVRDLSPWLWGMAFVSVMGFGSYINQYVQSRRDPENRDALKKIHRERVVSIGSLGILTVGFVIGALIAEQKDS